MVYDQKGKPRGASDRDWSPAQTSGVLVSSQFVLNGFFSLYTVDPVFNPNQMLNLSRSWSEWGRAGEKNDVPAGYAFIQFDHERDLKNAYKQGDGKKIDGSLVQVLGIKKILSLSLSLSQSLSLSLSAVNPFPTLLVGEILQTKLSQEVCGFFAHCRSSFFIDLGRRVMVDVERGRTVEGWLPRRLGGGRGPGRQGGEVPSGDNIFGKK